MTSIVPAVKESAVDTAVDADDWPLDWVLDEDPGAGRIIVGPNTVAKLWRDILLWGSYWLTLWNDFFISRVLRNHSTYITRWSIKKVTVFWLTAGNWLYNWDSLADFSSESLEPVIIFAWDCCKKPFMNNSLKASKNFWYKELVNRASGSSLRYILSNPVTAWISMSFKRCSASYGSANNSINLQS